MSNELSAAERSELYRLARARGYLMRSHVPRVSRETNRNAIAAIADVLWENEGDLSDGFEFYAGSYPKAQETVEEISVKILRRLQVLDANDATITGPPPGPDTFHVKHPRRERVKQWLRHPVPGVPSALTAPRWLLLLVAGLYATLIVLAVAAAWLEMQ
jgi:hypothetical protein